MGTITNPILSMYGIFLYISLMSMVNVGRYSIHGASGNHYKVPCETTRIQWKVAVFFLLLSCRFSLDLCFLVWCFTFSIMVNSCHICLDHQISFVCFANIADFMIGYFFDIPVKSPFKGDIFSLS